MDLAPLLPPIAIPAVCGPDPKAEGSELAEPWQDFEESLERHYRLLSQYLMDQQVAPDANRLPPDWGQLQERLVELAGKTKHLQLAVELVECLAQTEGLAGLRDGLRLLRDWSMTWWDYLHPGAVDEDDKAGRSELISGLASPRILIRLERMPLVEVSEKRGRKKIVTVGPYSLRDFEPDQKNPGRAGEAISAFSRLDPVLQETLPTLAAECIGTVASLERFYAAKGQAINLENLTTLLQRILRFLRGAAPAPSGLTGSSAGTAGASIEGSERTRESVSATLDGVIRYFQNTEPSSPVPYLLQRAKRCIGKNYLQIVDELGQDRNEADRILKPEPKPAST